MADRFSTVAGTYCKALFLTVVLAGLMTVGGCKSVEMPDLSQLDFGLKEKPVVIIKENYNQINVRPTPSTELEPVATLKGGDQLKLVVEEADWLNVIFYDTAGNEQSGWVYKYLVKGYNKPGESGVAVTRSSQEPDAEPVTPVKTEPLSGEVESRSGELPKSEKVSPL